MFLMVDHPQPFLGASTEVRPRANQIRDDSSPRMMQCRGSVYTGASSFGTGVNLVLRSPEKLPSVLTIRATLARISRDIDLRCRGPR